jgi:hypothetical protein
MRKSNRVDLERQHKEKQMGRPIQKRKIGLGTARIEVTAARFSSGGVVTGNIANPLYIKRQRGSLQFIVVDSQSGTEEKLKLVGKATPAAGEFCIAVTVDTDADNTLDDSALRYVTKLHNRTVSVVADGGGTPGHYAYQLLSTGDNEPGDGYSYVSIDVQK